MDNQGENSGKWKDNFVPEKSKLTDAPCIFSV